MNEEEYDENVYFKCKKCKSICEKTINERTNKFYTICENCRAKCGSKSKKNKEEEEPPEVPIWKQKLFNIKPDKQKPININLEDNDIETESEDNDKSDENDDDKPNTINGELMAGSVENIDDIKKNITTLSLNDKVKYIIDLLTEADKTKLSKQNYIVELLDTILSKLKDNRNEINDNNGDDTLKEINSSLKSINKEIDKIKRDMNDIKSSII